MGTGVSQEPPTPNKELQMIDGFWEKQSQFFFKSVVPGRSNSPGDDLLPMFIWVALIGLNGL